MDADDDIDASSDSSDFYSAEPAAPSDAQPRAQTAPDANIVDSTAPAVLPGSNGDIVADAPDAQEDAIATRDGDDQDSSSEMDLSDESRPPTPAHKDAPSSPSATENAIAEPPASHPGAKRKLSDVEESADGEVQVADDQAKKQKTSPQLPQLSPAIWQRIFYLLPPAMLCRCLRVCKDFNRFLTEMKAPQAPQKDKFTARVVDSEAIWIQSRKNYFPQLPRPLRQHSELDMLQLVGGQACQFCGKLPSPVPATSVFNCGPGTDGVRVIFPFAVRTCGACIEPLLRKDVQLLTDSTSARLRLGIAHAFRNEESHFVTETVRQIPPGIPGSLRFSKVYYQPQLAAIKQEEDDAQQLGQGAADEWRKGLYNKGKDAMADSARWEKWEAQLRLGANLAHVLREYDLSSFPQHVQAIQSSSAGASTFQSSSTTMANGPHPLPQPVHVFHNGYPPQFPQYQQLSRPPLPQQHQLPFPPPLPFAPHQAPHRVVRNPQEVESARQARRAEIERRCKELEPPVEPNVLQHMESFQAAMQITTPLTDAAWDMLKPRILAQRESAELAEHMRASQLAALQAAMPSVMSEDIISRPAKEVYDREYEDSQLPLRKRLGEYADDLINGHWGGGKMLGKDNVPIFAIHVLQHVRQRYVQDKELGLLADLETTGSKKLSNGQTTPQPAPFLSLDNMKWVYDNKVRSFTDVHRKEHFICAGCDEEKKPKWFAFEGLIQHYGAKHTTAFSKGNIVVHWQTAEWPDPPPFHTNPAHWLKMDRRASEFKKDHRARNTPQGTHGGSSQASANALPMPQNTHSPVAVFGSHSSAYPYQAYGRTVSQTPQTSSNGYHIQSPGSLNGAAHGGSQETQLLKLASDSREVWDTLEGVKDLLESIQVQTVLHHAVLRFGERFHYKPTLDMLTDALATHNSMRPLKNVTGLACKSCVAAGPNSHSSSYWTRIRAAKFFNTSSLITHFKLIHQPHDNIGPLDWVKDMIEVPERQILNQLLRTPGMDDGKLSLIAAAFPSTFPMPLPKIGHITEDESRKQVSNAPVHSLLERLGKKSKAQSKKKSQKGANGVQDRDSSNEPLPEPKEDEYDPSRPALVQSQTQLFDPAQFDTDARKTSTPATAVAQAPSASIDLNPETISMLQNLAQFSKETSTPNGNRVSRSPSVGRAESASGPKPTDSRSSATQNGQPDIAAILAALTGQSQSVAPSIPEAARTDSIPRPAMVDACASERQEVRSRPDIGARSSSQHYNAPVPVPRPAPASSDVHELQAALSRNTRHFDQNQRPSHAERTYSNGPQPHSQPAPQYQYIYEHDHAYGQAPPPHTAVYREVGAPQYVQISERDYVPHGYQYERPAPKPLYVDQYGRPLIPIDSAPAPIQYLPNPYEQQQHGRPQEHTVYASIAPQPHLQPFSGVGQPVYYEQAPGPVPSRYAYDDRASVGRP
ncbi:hypothetical protein CB0940_01717 [Cercospora beticola]|uniref:DUF7892 domain-containing protein n=1 Tax=Cercospora beticola TaxID=122368 RepID=A0A2G5IAB2_CERBT|nr:hypothetical protein CB0940_01717 [Cercospora beticola]PIB01796.1 hypothetical protein CB0940_01717 [Cercospora beticola]WPA97164.1 hypothetical protein RHO25_001773 [Cercospora beticola]